MLSMLASEMRQLARPLVGGKALAIVAFCLLITWGAAKLRTLNPAASVCGMSSAFKRTIASPRPESSA